MQGSGYQAVNPPKVELYMHKLRTENETAADSSFCGRFDSLVMATYSTTIALIPHKLNRFFSPVSWLPAYRGR